MSIRYQVIQSGGVFDLQSRTIVAPDKSSAAWKEYQTWLTNGGTPLPPDTIGQETLANAKLKRQSEIDAYAAGLRNTVIRGRSSGEMASWALKLFDAMAVAGAQTNPFASVLVQLGTILNLPRTPTSYNDAIAQIRGITEVVHVNKVLQQSVPFLAAEAAIDGVRGRHCDSIEALTTIQEIITYDWHTGWPAL